MLDNTKEIVALADADGLPERFGARAARLGRLIRLGLPVPPGAVLSPSAVEGHLAGDQAPELESFQLGPLLALRSSVADPAWGGPSAMLNIGMTAAALPALAEEIGAEAAHEIYARAIQSHGVRVAGIDAEAFEALSYDRAKLQGGLPLAALEALIVDSLQLYEDEAGAPYPQDGAAQLAAAVAAMAKAWSAPSAKILRQAKGAPEDAGLGLVVQRMVFGIGRPPSGNGSFQAVDGSDGASLPSGRFIVDCQSHEGPIGLRAAHFASVAEREAAGQTQPALEELAPAAFAELGGHAARLAAELGEAMALSFTLAGGALSILDAQPVKRSVRAAIQIAVDLAEAGHITRDQAILRTPPQSLISVLHAQIAPDARRDVVATGLPASPGAAVGRIVLTPEAAMTAAAQDEAVILLRPETTPEDTRGVQASAGVLTIRGGMSSHAAVIARGLGRPAVVGARDLFIDGKTRRLRTPDGRSFGEGDVIAIDGSTGDVLAGAVETLPASTSGALATLMGWADARRSLAIRANADTVEDAAVARRFGAEGIGLCRSEHLFLEGEDLSLMRQMILAEDADERGRILEAILPRHRAALAGLFEAMAGQPVTVRLLDPPLHEFLPNSAHEFIKLARAMDLPADTLVARAGEMREVNPMLGLRGVRLGVVMPEIYDMQARAILEAALAAGDATGAPVRPEIMVPLVSANREAELVTARIDAVATTIHNEQGRMPRYEIGVMVETPRGALRAGELAQSSAFVSFGTNDLTQMSYGLSRDDAGRFMRAYVQKGIFNEDPFHTLDPWGVGELIELAIERGRATRPDLKIGLCGEHGGDPASIAFCVAHGFDYVSCSPYRVPIARLAAAHAALEAEE